MASYDYSSKEQLLETIRSRYVLLDGEFDTVDEGFRDLRLPQADKTPSEIIAYQLGWLNLVMGWDRDELEGREVEMPAPGYRWNRLGEMYSSFYRKYEAYSLRELRDLFRDTVGEWEAWIGTLSEEELFVQGHRRWTGSKENWPMARWIHINSVAPFTSFRTKLRKWKKALAAAQQSPTE
ncbi:ClbS/DfsB family four-helix bundle protein [Paenibacillus tepidiphilus]|uniref:ClbS/DfsB family four-helix bundle protein n=1 Tax=Paenibacillus tepidiphilus TaxID=2608683 RepID=UPI00123B02E2|nr:ClbS/DfsB family four-helix bundle protein [Paenibacillus tepidiphilus]